MLRMYRQKLQNSNLSRSCVDKYESQTLKFLTSTGRACHRGFVCIKYAFRIWIFAYWAMRVVASTVHRCFSSDLRAFASTVHCCVSSDLHAFALLSIQIMCLTYEYSKHNSSNQLNLKESAHPVPKLCNAKYQMMCQSHLTKFIASVTRWKLFYSKHSLLLHLGHSKRIDVLSLPITSTWSACQQARNPRNLIMDWKPH